MVRIVEVGPRDGLQNEKTPISSELKLGFVSELGRAGLREIEATSFVSPKWVPQLADAAEVWRALPAGPLYSALVPNARGLQTALEVGAHRIAVFTAASEAFVQKNLNMTIDESLSGFSEMISELRAHAPDAWVRGYVSTIFACPYAGEIDARAVIRVVNSLSEMGVDEISLGDTIGVGVPGDVRRLHAALTQDSLAKPESIAWHFHDTRGTAIANVAQALELGYATFDASAGGLGGCPYAPGAGGNLATDDLVYFLERSGVETGVNALALAEASLPILEALGRNPISKAQIALLSARG
mgnify:CR=1 FL=1